MKRNFALFLITSLFLLSCTNEKPIKINLNEPNRKIEVIPIPSEGIVNWVEGEVLIKREKSTKYENLNPNCKISFEDILEIRKGARLKISFKDDSSIIFRPIASDRWLTFEKNSRVRSPHLTE